MGFIKAIIIGMLSTMSAGLVGFIWVMFVDIGVLQSKVANNRRYSEEMREDIKDMKKMVDDIHWFLIERKGIERKHN